MLYRGGIEDASYAIAVRDRSLSVGLDDHITVACDHGGRLYSYFRDGVMHRRSLNGHLMQKWHDGGGRHSRWLAAPRAEQVLDEAAGMFRVLRDRLELSGWAWEDRAPEPGNQALLDSLLTRAAAFDATAAALDARRFGEVYAPVGILPPDHYLSLVLQATEGCTFGTCTFCSLYDRGFRVKDRTEFAGHIAAVRAFFGDALNLRAPSIFLGAANALAVPMARLVPLFEEVVQAFGRPRRGIHAFVDGFTGGRKTEEDYRRLGGFGLRRIYLGLESGHDPLLDFVRKPATGGEVVQAVGRIKAAGLSVAPIVIIGLGGRRFAEAHVRDTTAVLNAMDLGPGDLLYLSELVEEPSSAYPRLAESHGVEPLSPEELKTQRQAMVAGLRFPATAPTIADYDIREFIY